MTSVDTRVEEKVSATGGSARSQLYDLRERTWKPRPIVSGAIVAVAFLIPVLSSVAAVQIAARLVPRPAELLPLGAWVLGLIVLASVTMWTIDKASRRLLPMAAMLRLSLVFPDDAPSRFAVALKTGSGKALERALARSTTDTEFSTSEHAAALVVGLIGAVSSHDRLTRGHCERVRAYADLIGEEMALDAESRSKLHWAALLHDVGKLDVPAAILNKTEKLTAEEWQIIRGHPAASDRFLVPVRAWLGDWARAASEHHERYDGDGYPNGLSGEDISLAGRIVAVADAFDVMTAARSYKKPYPAAQARVELANNAGTQFDPKVVRAFLATPSAGSGSSWVRRVAERVVRSRVGRQRRVGCCGDRDRGRGRRVCVRGARRRERRRTGTRSRSSSVRPRRAVLATSRYRESVRCHPATPRPAPRPAPAIPRPTPFRSRRSTWIPPRPRRRGGTGGGSTTRTPTTAPGRTVTTTPGATTPGDTTPVDTTPVDTTPGNTVVPTPVVTTPVTTPGSTVGPTPVTIAPAIGHAPVARNDTTGTLLNKDVLIAVLANDTDVDGNIDPGRLTITSLPASGAMQISVVGGQIRVQVAPLYSGTLTFNYQICDTTNLCAEANVTVTFLAAI